MPTLYCPTCDYNLTGLPENRCPECGGEFDPDALAEVLRFRYEPVTFVDGACKLLLIPVATWISTVAAALLNDLSAIPVLVTAAGAVFVCPLIAVDLANRVAFAGMDEEARRHEEPGHKRRVLLLSAAFWLIQVVAAAAGSVVLVCAIVFVAGVVS